MKLLSINIARSLWFFPLNNLNPRGKAIERLAFQKLGQRYAFGKVPTLPEMIAARQKNEPYTFVDGVFKSPTSGEDVSVHLTLYRDAMFADTRSSTKDSDAFLTDMLEWFTSEFKLVDHKTIAIRRLYVSEMYISLDKSLMMINPKLSQFTKALEKSITTPFKNIRFELATLGFWIDPEIKHVHVPFRLERQEGTAFAEERHYSIAPLETEEHLKMIETLEKLMAG